MNSAIFCVVDALLFRALPYRDPDSLAVLLDVHAGPGGTPQESSVSSPNFLAWREQAQAFESLEALATDFFNLTGGAEPERVDGASVTAGFFSLLGVRASHGRTFLPEEGRPGGAPVVLLSDAFWRQRFAADPKVVGRPVQLNGQSYTVIGVLPKDFHYTVDAQIWAPLIMDPANPPQPNSHYLVITGRLRPDQTIASAQAEMTAVAQRLERDRPGSNAGWSVSVKSMRDQLIGNLRRALLTLAAAVGFVLLIACFNVVNLLLVRNTDRKGEVAIRSALGASRGQIIRQLLIESILLSLLGGALGLLLAWAILVVVPLIAPVNVTLFQSAHIDLRVIAFTFVLSLLTGLLPVLVPALHAQRPDLHLTLKSDAKRSSGNVQSQRLQGGLVVSEMALALVLLICAGLMVKSLQQLSRTDPGFEPQGILVLQVSLPDWKYTEPARRISFWQEAIAGVQALPGVEAAGATSALPVNPIGSNTIFIVENRAQGTEGEALLANFRRVTPDYFKTLKIPLLRGRSFQPSDDDQAPAVVVISKEMARRYWPGEDPIGKRIQRVRKVPDNPWLTVVGVVDDVQDSSLGSQIGATFYIPFPQNTITNMYLTVRTSGDPQSLTSAVRRVIQSIDREQPVAKVTTLEGWISDSLSGSRFNTMLLAAFAGLGMLLAIIGIYGVLSYSVAQRNREIGIRMALGAQRGDIVTLILRRGMVLTGLGLGIGLMTAIFLTRLLSSLLYGVTPTDPLTFLGVTVTLIAVALLASYIPARRALRVDPIVCLKHD